MNEDILEPLARLSTTAGAVEGLRDLFAAEEPLDVIASRVARTAVVAIPGADAVSITVLSGLDARTAASTDERATELDGQQYASGLGPCLEAAMSRIPVRSVMSEEGSRWPKFVETAQRIGIRASLSVPLVVGEVDEVDEVEELVGSLNIYSATASAFDPFDEELMRLYSVAAGQAISNASRWQRSRTTVTQLEQALTSRSDIDMAKGALMAVHGCSPDEAFQMMVGESQRRNVKLRTVALEMLARLNSAT